ncbi:MAG: ZIP family metal transporter, partial [Candidatus Diapherotrites archaeon]|nr:ZIP family metal transporter [Candidatus Diapherotrites archaeon]
GFVVFFIIERILHWHHCHEGKCDVHPMSYLVLIGDGIHNFIDGLVIAASFIVGVPFGIITTLLIIGHEVPQELGNFGILVYGGFGRKKALLFSLMAQATCIIGGITGYFISSATSFSLILLPFAAGGFIYIGASDLIPELHKESNMQKAWLSFLLFIAGIAFMAGLKVFFAGA